MSLRPQRYIIVASTARKIEQPEEITDAALANAIFRQHCADLMGEHARPVEWERNVFWEPIERTA